MASSTHKSRLVKRKLHAAVAIRMRHDTTRAMLILFAEAFEGLAHQDGPVDIGDTGGIGGVSDNGESDKTTKPV